MLQNGGILGEIIGTQRFTVRRVEFGCIMKAGGCPRKPLKGSLFSTNQSMSATNLIAQLGFFFFVRVDKNVVATATVSHGSRLLTRSYSSSPFSSFDDATFVCSCE